MTGGEKCATVCFNYIPSIEMVVENYNKSYKSLSSGLKSGISVHSAMESVLWCDNKILPMDYLDLC